MVSNLIILESAHLGARDLFWIDDPDREVIGYDIYRASNAPTNWIKVNRQLVPGNQYRDENTLELTTYDVVDADWVERGEKGSWIIRIPDTLWSDVVDGKVLPATNPEDARIELGGVEIIPARVIGSDGEVWLPIGPTVLKNAGVSRYPYFKEEDLVNVRVKYKKLVNSIDIYTNLNIEYYTVVPILNGGVNKHNPGELGTPIVNTMEVGKMDYMQAEMVRRNTWLFEQVGEPAYLMIRRTKGEICGCVNSETGQARTGCKECYETRIVGGFYGPFDILFIDPDQATTRTLDEGGVKVERESRSYLPPSPIVQDGDMIVRRNGERLVISGVVYKSPRGVLLQQDFNVQLLPVNSNRYLIPVTKNALPVIYNPPFSSDGNQPLSDPLTDPTKQWENEEQRPIGRTTTYGRIMS